MTKKQRTSEPKQVGDKVDTRVVVAVADSGYYAAPYGYTGQVNYSRAEFVRLTSS